MTATTSGSSPLTRGKPGARASSPENLGLIPAHAGKTLVVMRGPPGSWAHPRSRGENRCSGAGGRSSSGSSPLTRGKRRRRATPQATARLIPAHAGKTRRRAGAGPGGWAHPRSRGENTPQNSRLPGTLALIPAHAGKTHFLTCAFIAQIDQILESLELCASSESYSLMDAYATDAPQDQVRSTGLAPRRSRDAS